MAIHVGQFGFPIRVRFKKGPRQVLDISAFETVQLLLTSPGGTTSTKTLSVTDATQGEAEYEPDSASILSAAGQWRAQGKLTDGSDAVWYSDVVNFKVESNLT